MQEMIIIYLEKAESALSWVTVNADGSITQPNQNGQADELCKAALDKQVIVVVPAESVLLASVELPKMPRARLLEALPYALEEQLVADVDTLHFAAGDRQADDSLPVAVVAKQQLETWLAWVRSLGVTPHAMVSEVFGLPVADTVWHVALRDHAIVRTSTYQGFGCDLLNGRVLLEAALNAVEHKPELLQGHDYASNGQWQWPEACAYAVDKNNAVQWYTDSADVIINSPSINLLQGVYRSKKTSFIKFDKMRQTLIAFIVAWIALLVLYPTISYFMLSQRASQLSTEIAAIYHHYFPGSKEVIAPKQRLEEKWLALSAEESDSKLLTMLSYLGQALTQNTTIELNRLDFQNDSMTIEFLAASSSDYAQFTKQLAAIGLRVKEKSANLSGTQITATILLEY